jgi:prepilin-type N-terminal cleavage/methylation domain-containing protein
MQREIRRGITLIELLTVVAVVGVLLAILLPAIRQARAAAREGSCVNHLKQMSLALHNYFSTWNVFPMSQVQGDGHANGHSVFTSLLPFIEQAPLYNMYNFHQENWQAANHTVVREKVDVFLCPDNPDTNLVRAAEVRYPESRSSFAKGHYGANWGGGRGPWGEDFAKQKGTYLGVMMTVIAPDGQVKARDGKPRARNIGVQDITDGTSVTLALVEKRDSFGWAVGGWGGSEFDVHTAPAYDGNDPLARKVYTGSTHEAGPTAAMCDGSVRTLPAKQDQKTWYALLTRAGGERVKFEP